MQIKCTRGYLAVFGGVILPKAWCQDCEAYVFVRRGILACCDKPVYDGQPEQWKRESLASGIRQKPSRDYQLMQLDRQHQQCFYCLGTFGSHTTWKKRLSMLAIHWDHLVPFAFLQTNPEENFVASCQICNSIKHSKMFQTVEEARRYVAIQRSLH